MSDQPAKGLLLLVQLACLLCAGSLFALLGLQRFFVDPIPSLHTNLIVFTVQSLPILLLCLALVRLTRRCAFWSAMTSLLYFVHGIMLLFSLEGRLLGGWQTGAAVLLFLLSFWLAKVHQGQAVHTTSSTTGPQQTL